MGVLNVTPDSFSDGGDFLDPEAAIAAGLAMAAAGADIIDVGGESTRPRSQPTSPDEEQARILPVIRGLAAAGLRVSVDTRHAATMAAALDAGAAIVNDVSALAIDPAAAPLVAARGCPVVLMHMRGTPADMYAQAHYDDVAADVRAGAWPSGSRPPSAPASRATGSSIDPGIGFAKTRRAVRGAAAPAAGTCARSAARSWWASHASRSWRRSPAKHDPRRRLPGSLAAGLFALSRGAAILRVHDVAETIQAIKVWQALAS